MSGELLCEACKANGPDPRGPSACYSCRELARERKIQPETINHPSYYGGDTTYETVKVIAAWGLGFLLGNTIKYISRAGKKDPTKFVEDLKKARWYLDHAIQRLERGEQLF